MILKPPYFQALRRIWAALAKMQTPETTVPAYAGTVSEERGAFVVDPKVFRRSPPATPKAYFFLAAFFFVAFFLAAFFLVAIVVLQVRLVRGLSIYTKR
jgi:hypothetical protein